MYCHIARGQWLVQLLQCTPTLLPCREQWNSCNAVPHCLWGLGNGIPAMCATPLGGSESGTLALHHHTAWGQWAMHLLQCTATLPQGSGKESLAMHCHTAWGQWA